MATYELKIGDAVYEIRSEHDLDDADLRRVAFRLGGKVDTPVPLREKAKQTALRAADYALGVPMAVGEAARNVKKHAAEIFESGPDVDERQLLTGTPGQQMQQAGNVAANLLNTVSSAGTMLALPFAAAVGAARGLAGPSESAQHVLTGAERVLSLPNTLVDTYYQATGGVPETGLPRAVYNFAHVASPITAFGGLSALARFAPRGPGASLQPLRPGETTVPVEFERVPPELPAGRQPIALLPPARIPETHIPPEAMPRQARFLAGETAHVIDRTSAPPQPRFVTTETGRSVDVTKLSPGERAALEQVAARRALQPLEPPVKRPFQESPVIVLGQKLVRPEDVLADIAKQRPPQPAVVPSSYVRLQRDIEAAPRDPLPVHYQRIPKKPVSLETWADNVIREGRKRLSAGLDPELLAAYSVKGAYIIARGTRDFSLWSKEMLKQYGNEIRPHLQAIYDNALEQAKNIKLAPIQPTAPPDLAVTGSGQQNIRKSAARASSPSSTLPPGIKERLRTSGDALYEIQSTRKVANVVSKKTEPELMRSTPLDETYVFDRLELANRMFNKGDFDGGYAVLVDVTRTGTRMGQLNNQFKFLKGANPIATVEIINRELAQRNFDPLPESARMEIIRLSRSTIDAAKNLNAALDALAETKTPEAFRAALAAEKAHIRAQAAENAAIAKHVPKQIADLLISLMKGGALTTVSHAANLTGNIMFMQGRQIERTVAAVSDAVTSALQRRRGLDAPRHNIVQPITGTKHYVKTFAGSLPESWQILKRGADAVKGENIASMHPAQALRDVKNWLKGNPTLPTRNGRVPLEVVASRFIESTLGVVPEMFLRGLSAVDHPFREAAKMRIGMAEAELAGLPRSQWEMAARFPELFFDPPVVAKIKRLSDAAVHAEQSQTIRTLETMVNRLSPTGRVLASSIWLYKLTPWNLIKTVFSFHPIIATWQAARALKKGNLNEANLAIGRAFAGGVMTSAGIWLWKNNLLSPGLDRMEDFRKGREASRPVLPPASLNISGLKRVMTGGDPNPQPGDLTVNYFYGGGLLGSFLYLVANTMNDIEHGRGDISGGEILQAFALNSTMEQARFAVNQSMMQGTANLLNVMQAGNLEQADNFLMGITRVFAGVALPNQLTAIARAQREAQKDLRNPNTARMLANVVRERLGEDVGVDRIDFWGRPVPQTPEGKNPYVHHLLDVFRTSFVTDDHTDLYLYGLWRRTGNNSVFPALPSFVISFGGVEYKLTPQQRHDLLRLVGQQRRWLVEHVVRNPDFYMSPLDRQVQWLDMVYEKGYELGKKQFLSKHLDQLTPRAAKRGFVGRPDMIPAPTPLTP